MPITTPNSQQSSPAFWRGARDGLPFVFVVGPFAVLFGVLATEAGLNVLETLAFSVVVIAGAAQFTALQLMAEEAPTLIVLASALAVNLRMAMYSASLTPYLGPAPLWQRALLAYFILDQSYACAINEFDARPKMPLPQRIAYFFGTVTPVVPAWYGCTLLGAMIGTRVPESWALDFALPITFLALVAPMLRTPAHLVAAFVSIVVSLFAAGLPYSMGLLVAGLTAMMAGAQAEVYFEHKEKVARVIDDSHLWIVIIGLGLGSYLLRFAFIGLVGDRAMPAWLLRHLRYTAVAILPALVAPQIVWPAATGGALDPARLAAALVTLGVGLITRNVFAAIFAGASTLYGMLYLMAI